MSRRLVGCRGSARPSGSLRRTSQHLSSPANLQTQCYTPTQKDEFFVPLLVVLELLWVLETAYDISRADILDAIRALSLMPILKFEQPSTVQKLCHSAATNKHDLSDLLIAYSAINQGCESVLTFDKKASKSDLFERVSA